MLIPDRVNTMIYQNIRTADMTLVLTECQHF